MEDIDSMGIKQLKEYITAHGGDYSDCVEKVDLKKRAAQVSQQSNGAMAVKTSTKPINPPPTKAMSTAPVVSRSPTRMATPPSKSHFFNGASSNDRTKENDEYVDEEAEISSSDEEEEDSGPSAVKSGKTQRRFSVFRVKKFMTSKIGQTSAGRATVMKVLGEDGDVVVQALKSVTSKIRDAKTAKEYKKDGIRFCLKAYNLWKHKDITADGSREMQTDAQLLAEIFCREVAAVNTGRGADVAPLSRVALRIHDACVQLMTPHVQPKNAARLSELLKFYASKEFFEALLNRKDCEAEREAMDRSTNTLLLPLSPILSGERERASLQRLQLMLKTLEAKKFDAVFDHPQAGQLFQQYLDLEVGFASRNGLRLLFAVRDYEKTARRDLMRIRAPKIVEKYLTPSAEFKVDGIKPSTIEETLDLIASGSVGMGTFSKVADEVRAMLEDDYCNQFAVTQDFMDLKKRVIKDIATLENQLKDEGSMAISPGARVRKSQHA